MMVFEPGASGIAVGIVLSALGALHAVRNRRLRNAYRLEQAARALETHYDAMAKVVDNPDLPYRALQLLSTISDAISDRGMCLAMTEILAAPDPSPRHSSPKWFNELRALEASHPDVTENFYLAIQSGFAAAFLRWPEGEKAEERLLDTLMRGKRHEAELAQRVFLAQRQRRAQKAGTVPA